MISGKPSSDKTSSAADEFRVQVIDVGAGTTATVFGARGAPVEQNAVWRFASTDLSAYAGRTIRLRFSATDAGPNGIVEAAFDDVRVTQPQ